MLSFHAGSAKRRSLASGASSLPPVAIRASSAKNASDCRVAATGWLSIRASSKRVVSRMSWLRTPTSGLAARVCCTANSRMSASAIGASCGKGSCVMAAPAISRRGRVFADEQAEELCDQSRLRRAFDLQRALEPEQHPPPALRSGREQLGARAQARAGLDGGDEADLVQSIVEPGRGVRRDHAELHHHGGDQRQREIAVGDRPAERAVAPGALGIDVDPLPIAGAVRELIDAFLVDRDPGCFSELAPDELWRGRHRVLRVCHGRTYGNPRRSLRRILPTADFGNASRKRTSFGTL